MQDKPAGVWEQTVHLVLNVRRPFILCSRLWSVRVLRAFTIPEHKLCSAFTHRLFTFALRDLNVQVETKKVYASIVDFSY